MQTNTVTASEIADFVYCPEAWRLSALGTKPTPAIQLARTEGTRHHISLTVTEKAATTAIKRGRNLVVVGMVALVVLAALWLAFQ